MRAVLISSCTNPSKSGTWVCLLTVRVFKNSKIGAVLERLLCKLNCIGSSSSTNFMNFRENCNAQGQAVGDFSGPADRVYSWWSGGFCQNSIFAQKSSKNPIPCVKSKYITKNFRYSICWAKNFRECLVILGDTIQQTLIEMRKSPFWQAKMYLKSPAMGWPLSVYSTGGEFRRN